MAGGVSDVIFTSTNERAALVRNKAHDIALNFDLSQMQKEKRIRHDQFRVNAKIFRKHAKHMNISIRIPRIGDKRDYFFNKRKLSHNFRAVFDTSNKLGITNKLSLPPHGRRLNKNEILPPISQVQQAEANLAEKSAVLETAAELLGLTATTKADQDSGAITVNEATNVKVAAPEDGRTENGARHDSTPEAIVITQNTFLTTVSLSEIEPDVPGGDVISDASLTSGDELAGQRKAEDRPLKVCRPNKRTQKVSVSSFLTKPVFQRNLPTAPYHVLPKIGEKPNVRTPGHDVTPHKPRTNKERYVQFITPKPTDRNVDKQELPSWQTTFEIPRFFPKDMASLRSDKKSKDEILKSKAEAAKYTNDYAQDVSTRALKSDHARILEVNSLEQERVRQRLASYYDRHDVTKLDPSETGQSDADV